MRVAIFVWVLLATLQLPAQQTSTRPVSSVLEGMESPKWMQRAVAFGEASDMLSSPSTPPENAERIRLGIIHLLVHENGGGLKEADNQTKHGSANSDGTGESSDADGEQEGEYYAGLIAFVGQMGDERAIPALLGASETGGIATRAVARFGKSALGPTLAQLKGQNPHLAGGALFVIRDMLEFGLISDPESRLRIKNALRLALGSPDGGVRYSAMAAIEYLKDREEFVPILKQIADHDPYKIPNQPNSDGSVGDFYFVRASAARLLGQILKHEQPPIDRGLSPSEYQPVTP